MSAADVSTNVVSSTSARAAVGPPHAAVPCDAAGQHALADRPSDHGRAGSRAQPAVPTSARLRRKRRLGLAPLQPDLDRHRAADAAGHAAAATSPLAASGRQQTPSYRQRPPRAHAATPPPPPSAAALRLFIARLWRYEPTRACRGWRVVMRVAYAVLSRT